MAAALKTCAEPGCITRLSRYNPQDRCYLHAVPYFVKGQEVFRRRRCVEELEGLHPEDLKIDDITRDLVWLNNGREWTWREARR